MFNKKNDPLVESVKAVMKQNEVHRQAEAALNEELGISSKKALPHEYHAQYDALLEAKVVDAEKSIANSIPSKVRNVMDKLTGNKGGASPNAPNAKEDPYKEQLRRRKGHPTLEEKTDMSKADIAALRHPKKKFTGADLAGLRAGEHKVGLEEKELTSAETSKKEELVKKMKKGDWSKRYGKRGKEVMYATATKMAKKLAEAQQGDLTGAELSGMPKLSKGLEDRKVQVPQPFTKPANPQPSSGTQTPPAPKKMNEDGSRARAARELTKKMYGDLKGKKGTEDPNKPADPKKFENELDKGLAKLKAQRDDYYNMKESVIAEIRENLEANLIAIHESGDDELFENYVNSLTEEELEILGLSEQSNLGGGFTGFVNSLSNVGSAAARGASKIGNSIFSYGPPRQNDGTIPAAPETGDSGEARGPAPLLPPSQPQAPPKLKSDPGSAPATAPATPASKAPAAATPAPVPGATAPATPASKAPVASRPATAAARPAARPQAPAKPADTSSYGQRVGNANRSGSEFTSRGERNPFASISESKQIKESLESFVRNRFLKG